MNAEATTQPTRDNTDRVHTAYAIHINYTPVHEEGGVHKYK